MEDLSFKVGRRSLDFNESTWNGEHFLCQRHFVVFFMWPAKSANETFLLCTAVAFAFFIPYPYPSHIELL